MKKNFYFRFLVVAIFILINCKANAQGTGNHFTMSLENCSQPSGNTIQFDLMIVSDGASSSSMRLTACSYGVNFNTAILPNGATCALSYVSGTSDIAPPLGTFTYPPSSFPSHLRMSESLWTGNNIWGQGIVNISGTAVTLVSGDHFICDSCGRSGITYNAWDTTTTIVVNGVNYKILSVANATQLTLTSSAGTQTGVSYSVSSPNTVNPMIVGHKYRVGTFLITSSASWVASSSPNLTLQDSTMAGHTNCIAIAYKDTAASSTAFSSSGIGDGLRNVSVTCSLSLTNCTAVTPTIVVSGDTLSCSYPYMYASFQWYLNGSPISGATSYYYVTTQTGAFTVSVADSLGCTAISNAITACGLTISVPNITNATCGTCANGSASANVQNGTPPYTITWYTSPITNGTSVTALLPGTYSVCARDANNCTVCTTFFVDSINCTGYSISTSDSNTTCLTCSDGKASVTATGGTPPYTYLWSNGTTTSSANTFSRGTYTISVTDAIGCLQTKTVTISVGYCKANYNLFADTVPHTYTIVNTASGVSPISYLWSWGDGATDTAAYPMHTYASGGFYTICLNITDFVGCTSSYCDSFTLMRMDNNTMIYMTVVPQGITGVVNVNSFYQTLKLFPNPANGSVTISYSLPRASDVMMEVYNSVGQQVEVLSNGLQPAGKQEIVFDTQKLPAGIYFVKATVDGNATIIKLVKM